MTEFTIKLTDEQIQMLREAPAMVTYQGVRAQILGQLRPDEPGWDGKVEATTVYPAPTHRCQWVRAGSMWFCRHRTTRMWSELQQVSVLRAGFDMDGNVQ